MNVTKDWGNDRDKVCCNDGSPEFLEKQQTPTWINVCMLPAYRSCTHWPLPSSMGLSSSAFCAVHIVSHISTFNTSLHLSLLSCHGFCRSLNFSLFFSQRMNIVYSLIPGFFISTFSANTSLNYAPCIHTHTHRTAVCWFNFTPWEALFALARYLPVKSTDPFHFCPPEYHYLSLQATNY